MKKQTHNPNNVFDEVSFDSRHANPKIFSQAAAKRTKSRDERGIIYEYFHDRDTGLTASLATNNNVLQHFHRCLEILYVLDGEMFCEVEDESFVAGADDIVFVHNYAVHNFSPVANYRKYFLVVPMNYADDVEKFFKTNSLPAHLTDKKFNRNLRGIFTKLYKQKDSLPTLVKKGFLNVIFGYLISHYPTREFVKKEGIELIVDILGYIDEHHTEKITLDSISESFGYNKYYFSKLFNRYVGETLNNYVNIVRLQYFSAMSKEDERTTVAERAFACGFESLTTFYRYYNKMYNPERASLLTDKNQTVPDTLSPVSAD